MAIIYTYPTKAAAAADLVLISDSADENKTKNASIASIRDAINVVDVISAGPGISVSNPTGNVTIGNTGVLSLIAGSNISLSGSTGNITISTSASNVDGSGTTNRIPRWTDSNTLGDSQIEQNSTSIGIGTALGTAVGGLEVYNGTLNNQLFITCPDTSQAAINFGGVSAKSKGRINYSDNSDVMIFHTDSSEKMRIDATGNVGIGTNITPQKLTVDGNVKAVGSLISDNGFNIGQIQLGSATNITSSSTTFANLQFNMDNGSGFSDIMKLQGNGNVGIATTSPNARLDVVGSGVGNSAIESIGDVNMESYNSLARVSLGDQKTTMRCPGGTTSIGDPNGDANNTYIIVDDNGTEIIVSPGNGMFVNGLINLQNLTVSGVQGNSGDVLTSSGTGVSWAPVAFDNIDHWFAGCASVGSSSNIATNPRQASFTFPNEVGSSNFGPCIPILADIEVIGAAIKWNGSNAPIIGANGTVDFKLGKLTDPAGNPDTQEGTVNYTNIVNLTSLQITSADSGTWILKQVGGLSASVSKGDVMVLVFPRPTTGWTGTGATNGDLQLTLQVKYV